jgi:hypothetical protein
MAFNKIKKVNTCGGGNAVYGIGFIGALFYFLQQASTFGEGILGFIKAIFWPAFVVYELLRFLNL